MKHSASSRLAPCDKNSEVESGLRPYEERAERPSVDVERTWNVRGAYKERIRSVCGANE